MLFVLELLFHVSYFSLEFINLQQDVTFLEWYFIWVFRYSATHLIQNLFSVDSTLNEVSRQSAHLKSKQTALTASSSGLYHWLGLYLVAAITLLNEGLKGNSSHVSGKVEKKFKKDSNETHVNFSQKCLKPSQSLKIAVFLITAKHQHRSYPAASEATLQALQRKGPTARVTQQDDNPYCKSTDPTACCFIFLHRGHTDLLYFSPFFLPNGAVHENTPSPADSLHWALHKTAAIFWGGPAALQHWRSQHPAPCPTAVLHCQLPSQSKG